MSEEEKPSNPNERVTLYGREVTLAQMEPIIKFYDADHQLTEADRKVMFTDVNWMSNTSRLWGMVDASLVFFAPTFYRRYTTSKLTNVAEQWRNMPLRQFIHRPFLSAMIGTVTYFVSVLYHTRIRIDHKVDLLNKEIYTEGTTHEEAEAKKRRLAVWKSMMAREMTFYYIYYWNTSRNPAHVLKDPREIAKNPHEIHYMPPSETAENQRLLFAAAPEHETEAPHWAKIRAANGFVASKHDEHEDNSAEIDGVLEDHFEDLQGGTKLKSVEPKRSAWDRVRKGN